MKSLGTRLALIVSLVLFILMMLASVWLERDLTETIHEEELTQAEVHAKTLLASLQTLMLNGQGTLAREWLDRMRQAEGISNIDVLRKDGEEAFTDLKTVAAVNDYLGAPQFTRMPVLPQRSPLPEEGLLNKALRGEITYDMSRDDEITVLMPIPTATECLSCHGYDQSPLRGVLRLSLSAEKREQRVERMRNTLWGVSLLLAAILALAMLIVLRFNVLRPINQLRNAISLVGMGDRDAQLPVEWKDELGEVAVGFNRMQKDLRASETRIRSVMDNVAEAIIIIDEQGIIETANPAVGEIFGYELAELVGNNVSLLMPEPYKSTHDTYLENYLKTGKPHIIGRPGVELVGLRKNGNIFPMEISISEMRLDDGRYFVGIVRDITERKEQTAAIEHQAMHDALTDLPNRSLLADRLRQAVLRSQRSKEKFALLLMDLDRFKEINDTLGHHYGDLILKKVASRMREALRESDTVARLGGDEFAVLLPASDIEHASQVSEKLLKSLDKPFVLEGQALHLGASIGIALFPDHGEDEITLMRLADVAMYVAKRASRGYSVYDPTKDEHNPKSLALLGDLRMAIDMDELVLHYQPKVDMKTHRVRGVEALVRWQHPEHGLMFPDEFIPLAEQTGLIRPLTMWVLKEALRQMSEWRRAGIELEMSINMSVRNLQDIQFPERVAKVMETMCKNTDKLWLEITETAIMSDPERSRDILASLNDMHVKLSIDDFGTGYSSLAYLKQLPVREIKIDKSFVMGMADSENDAVIVRSIIDLAHNIGLVVIAEGVEDERSYHTLEKLGCDLAQGYFISRPVPVKEFDAWLGDSRWGLFSGKPQA